MLKKTLAFSLLAAVAIAGCSDNDTAPKPAAKMEKPKVAKKPKLSKAFKRLDANGDAKITRKEYLAPFEERFTAAFGKLDGNQDSNLSMEEFLAAKAAQREKLLAKGSGEEEINARFSKQYSTMDKDGNGSVSGEEYLNWRMRAPRKAFRELDSDNNKRLSPAEFAAKPKASEDGGSAAASDANGGQSASATE
jgi:Ca2+-binding EF-hand superfamily protein